MRFLTVVVPFCVMAAVAADAPAPTFLHSSVLDGVKLDPRSGELYLYNLQGLNLPEAESSSIYKYSPDEGGKLWAILTQTEGHGTEIAKFEFYCEHLRDGAWLLSSYRLTDMRTGEDPGTRLKLDAGDYVLDFHLQTGQIYSYPFAVSTLEAENGPAYFIDGDWNDWGYLYYPDADPDQSMQWKVWLRHRGPEADTNVEIRVGVMRESENNRLIATARPNMSFSLRHEWVRYQFDLIEPMQGTSGGRQLAAKDILVDGDYVLKMVVGDETYGLWRFSVRAGRLQPAGRTLRGEADPLTFVEGGKDAFWYGRTE